MSDWRDEGMPEYDSPFGPPDDEPPIAKLYRREYAAECMRLRLIDNFLGTLKPADKDIPLFTFAERKEWGLRVNARRSVKDIG